MSDLLKPSSPQCPSCGMFMRLILVEPDPTTPNEKRVYQCEACEILTTVTAAKY